jgi:predicted NBD/HSP70 family sugar kinase
MPTLFTAFLDRADRGDAEALQQLALAGRHLGRGVAGYINATSPGDIIITATDDRFLDRIKPEFFAALTEHALPGLLPLTKISFSATNDDWRRKSTAALALEMIYLREDA